MVHLSMGTEIQYREENHLQFKELILLVSENICIAFSL